MLSIDRVVMLLFVGIGCDEAYIEGQPTSEPLLNSDSWLSGEKSISLSDTSFIVVPSPDGLP